MGLHDKYWIYETLKRELPAQIQASSHKTRPPLVIAKQQHKKKGTVLEETNVHFMNIHASRHASGNASCNVALKVPGAVLDMAHEVRPNTCMYAIAIVTSC